MNIVLSGPSGSGKKAITEILIKNAYRVLLTEVLKVVTYIAKMKNIESLLKVNFIK